MSSTPLLAYAAARDALLADIVRALAADDRFVAAWLTGSFGRDQGDAVSDLDLTVVVTDAQRDMLCARPWMVGAGTTAKRLAVIRLFGEPAVLHENHYNAPEGGTFTYTLYAGSALMVDWVFVPFSDARRPAHARPLFAKAEILSQPPPTLSARPQRSAVASERVSFFWMLAAVTAKRRARGDVVDFHVLLDHAGRVVDEIRAQLVPGDGEPHANQPASPPALAATPAEQGEALRALCRQVLDLMPQVEALGGHVPPSPMGEIEALLGLL